MIHATYSFGASFDKDFEAGVTKGFFIVNREPQL